MKYAVGLLSLYEGGELEIKIVEAENWKDALDKAFPGYVENLRENSLVQAKDEAYDQEWYFDVVKI